MAMEECPNADASRLRAELVRRINARMGRLEGDAATAIPGLRLYRRTAPTACASGAYEPKLVFFLQGQKRTSMGREIYLCGESNFLLTSVDVPVVSQIVEASPEKPLLSLLLKLDMAAVRQIVHEENLHVPDEDGAGVRGMTLGVSTPELLGACLRLTALLDEPEHIPFLSGLIQREVVYRLLRSAEGRHLRAIATGGEQSHRTAKAVAWLRANYAKPLRVEDLAAMAHMGVSTLHHHFRSLTAMSPLQYQKQLRLHMARERMLHDGLDAAGAAFAVGYESASQFSREYARFFGQPPMRDVRARRSA